MELLAYALFGLVYLLFNYLRRKNSNPPAPRPTGQAEPERQLSPFEEALRQIQEAMDDGPPVPAPEPEPLALPEPVEPVERPSVLATQPTALEKARQQAEVVRTPYRPSPKYRTEDEYEASSMEIEDDSFWDSTEHLHEPLGDNEDLPSVSRRQEAARKEAYAKRMRDAIVWKEILGPPRSQRHR